LRFTPGFVGVTSGDDITFEHDDRSTAPHTATIVEEFPGSTLEEIFGCGAPDQPCGQALAAHEVSGLVVDPGNDGFNEPGDSLLFFDDGSISAPVTAPAGTTLKYLCAIHPWMQGEIKVR
jgi:plastocyanin